MMDPAFWIFIAIQLIGFGALRQSVKDLKATVLEERLERRRLEERVRNIEIRGRAAAAGD